MEDNLMQLKEVCKELGVTRKIVQTYEQYGLVAPTSRNKYGYLLYDEDAVERIKIIRRYQRFGYSMYEIASLEEKTFAEQKGILKQKIVQMYQQQEQLAKLIKEAEALLENM